MSKILNRRHLYQISKTLLDVAIIIEKIDTYLDHSKKLEKSRDEVVVYAGPENEFFVGREVFGHEQKINLPEEIYLKDYTPCEIYTKTYNISSEQEFLNFLQKLQSQNYLRMRFYSLSEISVDFCNTEK